MEIKNRKVSKEPPKIVEIKDDDFITNQQQEETHDPEDDEPVHFSFFDIIRMLAGLSIAMLLISSYFTNSLTFGYNGKLIDPHFIHYQIFGSTVNLTEAELALYNGTDPELPLYVAINGTVFDVSSSRGIYGPKGSYSFFAGIDCGRALATNCLNHLTHDIRDIRFDEERRLKGWIEFFDDKYFRVGTVHHEPLEGLPMSREDCKGKGQN